MRNCQPTSTSLASNLAAILYFGERQVPSVADYSLNAANELTAQHLRDLGSIRVSRLRFAGGVDKTAVGARCKVSGYVSSVRLFCI